MPRQDYLQAALLGKDAPSMVDNASLQDLAPLDHFSTHLHPTVELIICTAGQIDLTLFQTRVTLRENEYLVIYPRIPHCSDAGPQGCSILQLHFHADSFRRLFSDSLQDGQLYFLIDLAMNRRRFLKQTASPQFYSCVLYLKQELEQKQPNYRRMCDLYLFQLILLLSRQVQREILPHSLPGNRHLILAAQYIQQHYAEKITIDRLAEYCGVSSRQLAGLFSTRLNMNFSTYLCYFRISKAIELMELREGRCPLTQLALDCGFGGLSHFSRVFKEKMGLSPTRYFSAQLR